MVFIDDASCREGKRSINYAQDIFGLPADLPLVSAYTRRAKVSQNCGFTKVKLLAHLVNH
jgi:hypothetical protein